MTNKKAYTFSKAERIKSTKRIDNLFASENSFISYPLRVVYREHEQNSEAICSILVTVPKKRIKKAVHRNLIKRLIRESYRLNKGVLESSTQNHQSLDIAFVYVKDTGTNYYEIQKAMKKALLQIEHRINKTNKSEQS